MSPARRERDDDHELVHVNVVSNPPARSEIRVEALSIRATAYGLRGTARRSNGRWRPGHGALNCCSVCDQTGVGRRRALSLCRDQPIPSL
jgi:hypothetical protein